MASFFYIFRLKKSPKIAVFCSYTQLPFSIDRLQLEKMTIKRSFLGGIMNLRYCVLFLNFLGLLVLNNSIQAAESTPPAGSSTAIIHSQLKALEHFLFPSSDASMAALDAALGQLSTKEEGKKEYSALDEKALKCQKAKKEPNYKKAKYNPYTNFAPKPSHKQLKL
ncbi:MAG TPA: hypothetical protein VFF04_01380 [Candidatus Babeliales bacterium]|nr:hypothetical protein [Candidatus Babeliales bacterium]